MENLSLNNTAPAWPFLIFYLARQHTQIFPRCFSSTRPLKKKKCKAQVRCRLRRCGRAFTFMISIPIWGNAAKSHFPVRRTETPRAPSQSPDVNFQPVTQRSLSLDEFLLAYFIHIMKYRIIKKVNGWFEQNFINSGKVLRLFSFLKNRVHVFNRRNTFSKHVQRCRILN